MFIVDIKITQSTFDVCSISVYMLINSEGGNGDWRNLHWNEITQNKKINMLLCFHFHCQILQCPSQSSWKTELKVNFVARIFLNTCTGFWQ